MNEVLDNIKTRRSIRSFRADKLTDAQIATILEAAIWAPSGHNKQLTRFTVLRRGALMTRFAKAIAVAAERDVDTYDFYAPDTLILASNPRDNGNGLADCAVALENMFLTAHAIGVGSVWINQAKLVCDEPAVRAILDELEIPQDHIVWGMGAFGIAAENPAPKARQMVINYIK